MTRATTTFLTLAGVFLMSTAVQAQNPDRTKRPDPLPPPTVELPAIQRATLSNGLSVWLVEQHKLPQVAFNLVIGAGSDHDPAAKPGLSTLTAEAMTAGTSGMDALAIDKKINYLAISLSFRAGTDASFATLTTLTKQLDPALELYGQVLTDPTFPAAEFERIRSIRLTNLVQQKDRAASIASLAFQKVLYGQDHPYGFDPSGTTESVTALTRDDLVRFYSTYYRPNNATLIVVGDVSMSALVPKLEKALGTWKKADVPALKLPVPPALSGRSVYLIDKKAAPQSEIRVGRVGLARSTPDFFPLVVMNRVLGGQFTSRINLNLREKRGFTYGATSSFQFLKEPGPFVARGGFVSTKTDSALEELVGELRKMHDAGMTAEELAYSKKGLTGSFALSFETSFQIAGALQNLVLYGLPDDYYAHYLQNIDKVTLDDVRRVTAAYLDPAGMQVVVVGDVGAIRPGIERLNLGPIVLSDPQGNPLK